MKKVEKSFCEYFAEQSSINIATIDDLLFQKKYAELREKIVTEFLAKYCSYRDLDPEKSTVVAQALLKSVENLEPEKDNEKNETFLTKLNNEIDIVVRKYLVEKAIFQI